MGKLVSVILPVYNGATYLKESIDSVLSQTYRDFELIVINDGSKDNSFDIINSYDDSRIIVINRQQNRGLVYSLNEGIDVARGEYIARQDADDISVPERFEKEVAFLDKNPAAGMVGSSYIKIDENSSDIVLKRVPETVREISDVLMKTNCFCHGSVVFRKECFEQAGGYRDTAGPTEDYDLWLRFSEITTLANIGEPLYKWRVSSQSIMSGSDYTQAEKSRAFLRKLAEFRRKNGYDPLEHKLSAFLSEFEEIKNELIASVPDPVYKKRSAMCFNIAEDFLKEGKLSESILYCLKSLGHFPFKFDAWRLLLGIMKRKYLKYD